MYVSNIAKTSWGRRRSDTGRTARWTAAFLITLTLNTSLIGQDAVTTAATAPGEAAHLPQSSLMMIRLRPNDLLRSDLMSWAPVEVLRAWGEEALGLDPDTIQEIKLVVAFAMGPEAPPFGFVIRLNAPYDPASISQDWFPHTRDVNNGRQIIVVEIDRMPLWVHAVDPQTIIVANPLMFGPMADTPEGVGPLAQLVNQKPMEQSQLQVLIDIDQVRPMLQMTAPQFAQSFPPPLSELHQMATWLRGIELRLTISDDSLASRFSLIAVDEDSAAKMSDAINEVIRFAQETFAQQMKLQISDEGKIAQAQRDYADRISEQLVDLLRTKVDGETVILEAETAMSVGSIGAVTGLLLPAIQSSRTAAKQMQTSNNLKQIALAIHNYHSAYNRFPTPSIDDKAGNPLLSWRVSLLPFLNRNDLYQQFHLDEPWDSPHNLTLVKQMPDVYRDPMAVTREGETIYQAVVDPLAAFHFGEETTLRDIRDGTSNTIMAVEVDVNEQVPWTAPIDFEVDWDNPVSTMGRTYQSGYHAVMADGSVVFLSHTFDRFALKALLTANGKEVVNLP